MLSGYNGIDYIEDGISHLPLITRHNKTHNIYCLYLPVSNKKQLVLYISKYILSLFMLFLGTNKMGKSE